MFPCGWFGYGFGLWWVFPVIIMVAMMIFCVFMMRRCMMSDWMGCCRRGDRGFHEKDKPPMAMEPKENTKENL